MAEGCTSSMRFNRKRFGVSVEQTDEHVTLIFEAESWDALIDQLTDAHVAIRAEFKGAISDASLERATSG